MIRIYVKGQELALYRDTTMTVELNNALFASPDIEGDISFSFTLPVEGNEILLEFAHLPQAEKVKKLPCTVYCGNGLNWNGQLLVQKGSHDKITAALILNPYPYGFGKKKLTENFDTEIVIATGKDTHDLQWKQFLAASVNNPDVKFAPFFNKECYGNDNEDYGFWDGIDRGKIVNALFFTPSGTIIDDSDIPFSRTHNERIEREDSSEDGSFSEMNQLAFCPQIRLARIMKIWCDNAGYKFIDHMGDDFSATFLQSQKSLDGTMAQYELSGITVNAETYGITGNHQNVSSDWHYLLNEIGGDNHVTSDGSILLPMAGWYELTLTKMFDYGTAVNDILLPLSSEANSSADVQEITDYGFRMAVYAGNMNLQMLSETNTLAMFRVGGQKTRVIKMYVNSATLGNGLRFVMFCKKYRGNHTFWYHAVNLKWHVTLHGISYDMVQTGFNIFRSKFSIPEMLPDASNSSFLKTVLETTGMCYFVSAKTKTIELVPYAMLKRAKSIDLTAYELTREENTETPEEKKRTFRLTPLKDESYNENLRLEDVDQELPDAYNNHEHFALRTKTNTLYRALQEGDSELNWVEKWQEYSGNPDRLEIGSGEEENREPSALIPHQRMFSSGEENQDKDLLTNEIPQLMVADVTVSSDIYNTTEEPSDIILTQYRGFRQREYQTSTDNKSVKNEVMLPVWGDGFALKAKGANSLGEKYVKPVLELLGHKKLTYKFRLPASMMQAVEDLLRPDTREPHLQTRYICVRNVRSVPQKITFQIDNDIDDTVLCKIEAVKVY
ncbi:MAG: hypothetical protein K5885_06640 [Bacteroidales bacterium]|nr:hypothetical protein [Bacteroidales bacterium]